MQNELLFVRVGYGVGNTISDTAGVCIDFEKQHTCHFVQTVIRRAAASFRLKTSSHVDRSPAFTHIEINYWCKNIFLKKVKERKRRTLFLQKKTWKKFNKSSSLFVLQYLPFSVFFFSNKPLSLFTTGFINIGGPAKLTETMIPHRTYERQLRQSQFFELVKKKPLNLIQQTSCRYMNSGHCHCSFITGFFCGCL